MAAADCSGPRRRFAVACRVPSQRVRAEAAAAAQACSEAAVSTMLLMPGADVAPDVREEEHQATLVQAQLTTSYGYPADRAMDPVLAAARQDAAGGLADKPAVARKASLQRFMEKRRDRLGARRAPYAAARLPSALSKKEPEEGDAGCWLRLGIPGGCAR